MKKKLETLQNHIIYDDYKKQVQVHKNKKHIIECFFVLVIGIIATISMITSNSDITPTD